MNRIQYIDGLRGLAIILVITYHLFSRWSILPYGDKYANFIVFYTGWVGVPLFFMISGFVIYMTLDKSRNFKEFILKRWVRLFPAMLIASIFSYLSSFYFTERPIGAAKIEDFIPGLVFISPSWLSYIFNFKTNVLEGGFWSLFVEVRFYFIFGSIYYLLGKNWATKTIIVCFFLSFLSKILNTRLGNSYTETTNLIMNELGLIHFGWFSLGILTFAFIKEKNVKWLYYAISMAIFSTLYSFISHEKSIKVLIALVAISVIFFLPIYSQKLKLFFENKFLSFVGFISYPLYLIHENFIISLTIKLHKIFPQIPALLLPILPLSLTVYIAYLITKYLEPYLTIKIKHYIF